jgi:tetratricopeptide (TPR) repeat protein
VVYKDQKKWPEAITSFENAAKYAPDNPSYQYELGTACLEARKFDQAKTAFESTVRSNRSISRLTTVWG